MPRDLRNVRYASTESAPTSTPLTDDEERRARTTLFHELGGTISERGWVRFPAHSPEERRRLVDVARRLGAHWGREVFVEAEDPCAMRLYVAGYGAVTSRQPDA
ncbi:hypothetical protein ACFXEL_06755 [Streptomyces sp. NPDC059382]|uniref:hypothetical protein n=1 Tax=Streptomyces sp. NPDC059382 TaxID=3346816 RepID=UPI003695A7B5